MLDVVAGSSFRDTRSEIVRYLNQKDRNVYLGIQCESGLYTILGKNNVHFSTKEGLETEISNSRVLKFLHVNALENGKLSEFKFVPVSEDQAIWVKDESTMCALWNIILVLAK